MASAVIGGLRRKGLLAECIDVIEPFEAARNALRAARGFVAHAAADSLTTRADLIVWALKPQSFANAASSVSSLLVARCSCR